VPNKFLHLVQLSFNFENEIYRPLMSSIIEGYSYDIFVSYRQKDNKHDGWVTEFVNELKGELEATFKEDISIYFDENPHDGLLETHSVEKSLEGKLKCLIFIPIISQTYCDTKSFAWQHEFCAFNKLSKEDQFGRDIRLTSGNVASRILSVKIHDLDPEDKELLENETGGVLRSIEFIYKSAGINRPLRANEDHPQGNLNKTYYRDQINKVANAIKEIITAIKKHNQPEGKVPKEVVKAKPKSQKNLKTKIIIASFFVIALMVLGYFFIPKLSKSSKPVEKSIAVLPFINDSPDQENTYFINGIMEEVLNNLQKIKDFRVLSRISTEQFRGTPIPTIPEIARKLNVNYIVEGSGQKYGNKFVLRVQLIAADNEKHLWGKSYEKEIQTTSDQISIQSEIAQAIATELKATITPEEKQLIEKIPTTNLTAYDFYQRGKEEYSKYSLDNTNSKALGKAEDLYHTALKYDSTFALAYLGLAVVYTDKHYAEEYYSTKFLDSSLILIDHALSFDDHLAEAYYYKALCYWELGRIGSVLRELDKALKYNPNYWEVYEFKVTLYSWNYHDLDYIKAIENRQKAISLNHGRELPDLLRGLGGLFEGYSGFLKQANHYFKEAFKLDNDSASYYSSLANEEHDQGNFNEAIEYYMKSLAIDSTNIQVTFSLANAYAYSGKYKESLKYYVKYADWAKATKNISATGCHRVGYSFWINGYKNEAEYWFSEQKKYCETSIKNNRWYATIGLATYYDLAGVNAFLGDKEKAYKNLKVFSKISICPIWWLTLIKNDPLFNSIRSEPEFQEIINDLEAKYQAEHERVGKWLEEQGML
jgi:TolB-like protein/Tfp pilus assembly protein PilF